MNKYLLQSISFAVFVCVAWCVPQYLMATDMYVSGITNPAAANGRYIPDGTYSGYNKWKHETLNYYIYNDVYSTVAPGTARYWNLDSDMDDETGVLFFSTVPSTDSSPDLVVGWSSDATIAGTIGTLNVTAGSALPEIDVKGNGISIVNGNTTILISNFTNFGSADISSGTIVKTFTVSNIGASALSLTGASPYVVISGANAAAFSVTAIPANSIAANGGSTTFQITFNPASTGNNNATITIANSDNNEGSYSFNIQGYGYTPANLVISNIATPDDANGTYVHQGTIYGFQYWKHTSLNYYLYNDDFTNTRYWNIDTDTDDAAALFYVPSVASTPQGVTGWTVGTGTQNATGVTINEANPVADIVVTGNSVTIVDDDATPALADNTNFGVLEVASGTRARTFKIKNTGSVALNLSGTSPYIAISGANASDFSVTTAPAASVAVNDSTAFVITFNPSASGSRLANVSISSNDPDESPYNFNIQGGGVISQDITVSDIDSVTQANGTYTYQGLLNEYPYWKHSSQNFYIYNSQYNSARYWNIDNDFIDTEGLFYSSNSNESYSPVDVAMWQAAKIALGVVSVNYSGPEISISGNGAIIIDGDITPSINDDTDFGNVDIIAGTIVRTFTINNAGSLTLSLTDASPYITISGNTADFTLTQIPSNSIAPAGATTFQVTFNPTTTGIRSATISLANNDSNENPYDFSIKGTGVAVPEMSVESNAITINDGDATVSTSDNTDFGDASVNDGSTVTKTFIIKNTGSGDLTLSGTPKVAISGAHAADFTVSVQPLSPVANTNGQTSFEVIFNPTAGGSRTAVISIANDDSDESTYNFTIQGNGLVPEILVEANATEIFSGDVTPSFTDHTNFGSADIVSGTITRTFTIRNSGNDILNLTANPLVIISGANATDFSIVAMPTASVAVGETTTFQVTFNPVTIGAKTATLSLANDDADENPYTFAIQATGTASPEIEVSGDGIAIASGDATPSIDDFTDFGNVNLTAGSISRSFSISNTGSGALALTGNPLVNITGANAGDFTVTSVPSTPVSATNGTTNFEITFNPIAEGARTATVNIVNDDADENTYTFAIQGFGSDYPSIQASNLNFTNITRTSMTVSWSRGNGANSLLLSRQSYKIPSLPLTDNTTYSVNQTVSGAKVEYIGSDNPVSVNIGNLIKYKLYYFKVCEFNGIAGEEKYLQTENASNPKSRWTLRKDGEELVSETAIIIYPNPATDNLNYTIPLSEESSVVSEVYSADGRLIKAINHGNYSADEHTFNLQVNDLPNGTYLLKINTGADEMVGIFEVMR